MTNTKTKKYTLKYKLKVKKYNKKSKKIVYNSKKSNYIPENNAVVKNNTNYIKSEISKMPKSIQNIIKINKYIKKKELNSDYNKIINSVEIDKLDNKIIKNKCINDISIYNISTEVIIDDFIVRKIPKGIHIYKGFFGFYTEKEILEYSKQNINKASWLGNKYVGYKWSKGIWGGLVSFKTIEDIYLIDFYNIHNINKIIELLESNKEIDSIFNNKKNFINKIKMITGINVSLLEQIVFIQNIHKWKELWIYTNPYKNKHINSYCNIRTIDNINPLYNIYMPDEEFILLFTAIINKNIKIDGFIKEQIYSSIIANGISEDEEFIIKNSSLLKKLKFDYDDPLCWVNWKNKNLKDYKLHTYNYNSNVNFVLSEFYKINTTTFIPLNNYNILSYNVHDFINLNRDITYETNINNNIELINYYKDNLNIMAFQEMSFIDTKTFDFFYSKIKDKFPYYYNCSNGSYKNNTDIDTLSIFVFTNKKYKCKTIKLQLTNNEINYITKKYTYIKNKIFNIRKTIRNIILLDTEYGKIAFIHLEIGLRETNEPKHNSIIKKFNSEIRIIMLKKILLYKPDIIMGDMNFTLNDSETNFLIKNNYYHQKNDGQNSTPYNRVDHCFISKEIYNKNNKIIENNKLLQCNYSDHLPMFQKLEII
jgi:endonuclease/exonuclease/phosphatase family metal-dependent hydrolase